MRCIHNHSGRSMRWTSPSARAASRMRMNTLQCCYPMPLNARMALTHRGTALKGLTPRDSA